MKKMTELHKLLPAILAFVLPLAVNAQTGNTMPDKMNSNNSSQMGNMAPAMNNAKMEGMTPKMMNAASPPQVGGMAPDFTLKTLDDQSVRLTDLTAKSAVVLVVLRGWPGYQCPFCSRQAHDFVQSADKFKTAGAQVLMVYPGPSDDLKAHAAEFLQDKSWPADFRLLLDPDYSFTKTYGLRWDAPKETAYPSTFIIGKDSKVTFARVTRQHGDRVSADTVLKALNAGMMSDRAMKGGM
jgi:peroxiredoxin